jgi:hypothetical protein
VGCLSQAQIADVNNYIEHLMRVMADTNPDGRLYALAVALTPLDRKGLDRQKADYLSKVIYELSSPSANYGKGPDKQLA